MRVRRPGLTAAYQYLYLRRNPVCDGSGRLRPGRLTWCFIASPSPLSRRYRLRLEYHQDGVPQVFVAAPDLIALADGRPLPHVHQQQPPRLCLYLPGTGEWTSAMRLDQTVVPWSILWLFYFEEWLISNEWKGGGVHPGADDANRIDG
jgi:hypothetical protein